MNLANSKQRDYQAQHPTSCNHRHHLHHNRHHHTQEQKSHQPKQHPRFLSLLLPRSPAALVSILILSSVWSLPFCCALDSVLPGAGRGDSVLGSSSGTSDTSSVLAPGHGTHSKRTILPFHFKLLQDYLHQHGSSRSGTSANSPMRYPVEMLIPPGIRIASDSGSHGLWWRSRRSAPLELDDIAVSMRSKPYPSIDLSKELETAKELSVPYSPYPHGELAIDDIDYFEPTRLVDGGFLGTKMNNDFLKPSKVKSKSFNYRTKSTTKPSTRRFSTKMRQKQKIIDALRRRDKAKQLAASRESRISSEMFLPTLSEAVTRAFQEFQDTKSENSFVKKHKSKGHKNHVPTPIFFDKHDIYPSNSFAPISNQEKESFKKAVGEEDEFLNELNPEEPNVPLGQMDWFVSSPDDVEETSPLFTSSNIEDSLLREPVEIQDTFVYDNGFGKGPGGSSSGSVVGHGLMSASPSDTFSHTGTFGASSPYGGEAALVTSSFGSGHGDGFGNFWGEGEFVSDDKDCADIETKTCETNTDCSCYGFYHCSQNRRCEALPATLQQTPSTGIWQDRPLGFGLSKRHAIQRGNSGLEPDPKLASSKVKKSGSRKR